MNKMADAVDFIIVSGGKTYELTWHVLDRPIFYMGLDWEARIHERMCTYQVNGKRGWGISEWMYRWVIAAGNY